MQLQEQKKLRNIINEDIIFQIFDYCDIIQLYYFMNMNKNIYKYFNERVNKFKPRIELYKYIISIDNIEFLKLLFKQDGIPQYMSFIDNILDTFVLRKPQEIYNKIISPTELIKIAIDLNSTESIKWFIKNITNVPVLCYQDYIKSCLLHCNYEMLNFIIENYDNSLFIKNKLSEKIICHLMYDITSKVNESNFYDIFNIKRSEFIETLINIGNIKIEDYVNYETLLLNLNQNKIDYKTNITEDFWNKIPNKIVVNLLDIIKIPKY